MAELAASVGHQLVHVDYDNNKRNYDNDADDNTSGVGVQYSSSSACRNLHRHDLQPTGDGYLLQLNPPSDIPSTVEYPPPPPTLAYLSAETSTAAVSTTTSRPSSTSDDSTLNCGDATSNTLCTRCGLQLHHHHHHHQHDHRQQQQQQQQQASPLVYGQLCVDAARGAFTDDRYPVGLRTPQ